MTYDEIDDIMEVGLLDAFRHGVEFLDETEPGWRKKIDITTFDISNPDQCVFGQIYNPDHENFGYSFGMARYEEYVKERTGLELEERDEGGFSSYIVEGDTEDDDGYAWSEEMKYEYLQKLWLADITKETEWSE